MFLISSREALRELSDPGSWTFKAVPPVPIYTLFPPISQSSSPFSARPYRVISEGALPINSSTSSGGIFTVLVVSSTFAPALRKRSLASGKFACTPTLSNTRSTVSCIFLISWSERGLYCPPGKPLLAFIFIPSIQGKLLDNLHDMLTSVHAVEVQTGYFVFQKCFLE